MSHIARLLLAASMGLALASGNATAQPAAAASMPLHPKHGASMPHDCKPMPMHGQKDGKEGKGMQMSRPMECPKGGGRAASAPAGEAKGDAAHDHSKPGKTAH
jgi:hypothetical protein